MQSKHKQEESKQAEMMRCLKKGRRERNAFVMMSGYHSSQLRQEPQPSSISSICILKQCCHTDIGGVSLLTVPLIGYRNRKMVNCLFLKTTIRTALS